MTGIYKEIELKLWRKDVLRLEKKHNGELVTSAQISCSGVDDLVPDEVHFLEGLAFTGLHNDVIDFTPKDQGAISKLFKPLGILLDKTLPCLSFVRSSNPLSKVKDRSYHFIHLTFQEYFAARYFVRQWKQPEGQLQFLTLGSNDAETKTRRPAEFLRKHKYTARYDVFWRFVAGLLDGSGEAPDFIKAIEAEPLDILGPTHQRLVMHCLSEISSSLSTRGALEKGLARWLLFECKFSQSARLASEVEFPESALKFVLLKESSDIQQTVLRSLANRASMSRSIIKHIAGQLKDQRPLVRSAAVKALSGRAAMPDEVLKDIAALFNDEDPEVRRAAVEALGRRLMLPDKLLRDIVALLNNKGLYI